MEKQIGVIGAGYWGKNLVRVLSELNALGAVCDKDNKLLSSFKKTYPDIEIYDDVERLLQEKDLRAVVIATPAATHFSLVMQALKAGKDVFVEKPISLKYKEGEELVKLADKEKKVLMVGHILEYHPAVVKLRELIGNGELGKIQYIYSNRLNLGKFRNEENILWSFAPHDISVILDLLGEMPSSVICEGGNYLNPHISDVTVSYFKFPSGTDAHIFVSWLHPYKEQKLVVIGDKKMLVFDDVRQDDKLCCFSHTIDWIDRQPVPQKKEAVQVEIEQGEPLMLECQHFLECVEKRTTPKTDGRSGLRVLRVLEACQRSLKDSSKVVLSSSGSNKGYFVHESSFVDDNVKIGKGTKIWHFSHILGNSKIGKNCSLGQNVMVGPNVTIGNNVKIQNNVSVYDGVVLEDDVFCGPSMVFTNVTTPRSHWPRKDEYKQTIVRKGVSIGANATVVCGNSIGRYAFVGAGALVNTEIPDYALVYGVPAKIKGWMCYCGLKLNLSPSPDSEEHTSCESCDREYRKNGWNVKISKKDDQN